MKETNATRKKDEGNMYIFHMLFSLQSIHYDFDFLRTISYIFFRWYRSLWLNFCFGRVGRAVKGEGNTIMPIIFCANHRRGEILGSDSLFSYLCIGQNLQISHAQTTLFVNDDVFGPQTAADFNCSAHWLA